MTSIIGPASYKFFGIFPAALLSFILPIIGIGLFTYIMARRIAPLVRANPDNRFDHIGKRIQNLIVIWLGQMRQPRYMLAGVLHIFIFAGFLILSVRSVSLVIIGFSDGFVFPGLGGGLGLVYNFIKDYAATFVLIACIVAAVRRGIYKPKRYAVPEKYGKDHTAEAVFVLGIISTLMISESLFEATEAAFEFQKTGETHFLAPLTLVWIFRSLLSSVSLNVLQGLHIFFYYVHDLAFFFFLCFLPMGKHFHVITSIFNVFFMRVRKGNIKPVMYGIADDKLDDLTSFGVKKLEDCTWKHM
ncbi:MAG: electron transfer flavoprotein, partial [Desulfobacula sp.]